MVYVVWFLIGVISGFLFVCITHGLLVKRKLPHVYFLTLPLKLFSFALLLYMFHAFGGIRVLSVSLSGFLIGFFVQVFIKGVLYGRAESA